VRRFFATFGRSSEGARRGRDLFMSVRRIETMPVLTRPTTSAPSSVGQSWRRRGIAALTLAFGLALAPLMTAGSAQAAEVVVRHVVHHPHHHHHHYHHVRHVVVHHPHG
jgi:hypothetical protein